MGCEVVAYPIQLCVEPTAGNSLDTCSCQTQYHRIEQVIQVAKLAALERRNVKLHQQINDAQNNQKMLSVNLEISDTKIEQLKSTINELMKRLETLSAKQVFFRSLRKVQEPTLQDAVFQYCRDNTKCVFVRKALKWNKSAARKQQTNTVRKTVSFSVF